MWVESMTDIVVLVGHIAGKSKQNERSVNLMHRKAMMRRRMNHDEGDLNFRKGSQLSQSIVNISS